MSTFTPPPTQQTATRIAVAIVADNDGTLEALVAAIRDDSDLAILGATTDLAEARAFLRRASLQVLVVNLPLDAGTRSGIDFIAAAKYERRDVAVLSLKRGVEEPLLRGAIEAGASACCLVGAPRARLLRAIKAVSMGATWLDPEVSEVIFRSRRTHYSPSPKLTVRERQVLQLITEGYSNLEMAGMLSCSAATIHTHVMNVFEKLDVHDRVSAAVYALRKGLISENNI